MQSRQFGKKAYAAVMFCLVSALGGVLVAGLAVPVAGLAATGANLGVQLLDQLPAELETQPQSEKSRVLLADGTELTSFYDENRVYVSLDKIAPIMRVAQVAIEDHRYYEHGAIDLVGTLRALVRNSSSGSTQGGSTLTQQYVKMAQIEAAVQKGDTAGVKKAQERTLTRKIQELRYALTLEDKFSKDEILEMYLNIAYYGDGAYGVEAAAHHYFNTSASKLTLAQAAMLAGLVQNPNATDPVNHLDAAMERRAVVLNRMAELGLITSAEADAAKATKFDASKVQTAINGCQSSRYPFLCDYVKRSLLNDPALGSDQKAREELLYRGGLTIQTAIDPKTQDAAQKAVSSYIDARDPVIATMSIVQPGTGLILAMAQSRSKMGNDAGETYYNYNVEQSMGGAEGYQAGSTFKAFVLGAALEKGIPPSRTYNAASSMDFTGEYFTSCSGRFKSSSFRVKNESPSGTMNMYQGTKYSVNTYYVQLEQDVSLCAATELADRVGVKLATGGTVKENYNYIPSFTLGTAEVTPLSMANAYATFAARGKYCDPHIVSSVTTKEGEKLDIDTGSCKQVIEQGIADGITKVLSQTVTSGGTAARAAISGGYDQAGKTGTIDGQAAIWMVGYTPQAAGAAMIAVDKTNSYWTNRSKGVGGRTMPYSKTYLTGSSGGDVGANIYKPAMTAALAGRAKTSFTDPPASFEEGKQVTIPSCSGLSTAQCKSALEAAGFNAVVSYEYSNEPSGTFLGLSKTGKAAIASTIYLRFSKGPQPVQTTQPSASATQTQATTQQPTGQQTTQRTQPSSSSTRRR
ncbi:transglycosylase domain-containing protein [Propionicicella superfundia]|uniref:transglycosylase domain-containing protein n=1 Tax=Propionicicella superfundia TaxID=348582 RepID=UPI000417A664|nr:transglycosylase domain-containing protein [Propionicicella superfundia]